MYALGFDVNKKISSKNGASNNILVYVMLSIYLFVFFSFEKLFNLEIKTNLFFKLNK